MEENTSLDSQELTQVQSLHEASRPSGLDLAARVYRGLISFSNEEGELPLIEDAYRLVRKESKFAKFRLSEESRLSYFDKLQGMLESGNEFPEDSSEFFELEPDEYETLKDEFDAYARDTTATYSAIEAIIEDMRNPLNSGQMVFKRIFGHFSQVSEKLGAQLSYNYFFNGNPFDDTLDPKDRYNIRSSVRNYFKRELLRSTRRYSSIKGRLDQDFQFASHLQQNTDTYVNRPGILPLMDLIRNSSTAIDIDIFQLQNESVMDMLVAHKLDHPELKLRIKLASLDEGRIDRVSSDILAPNSFVSGVFEALNIYGSNIPDFAKIEIYRARSRNHPKLIVGDKEAIIGSMNITYPLGNNPLKAGANFEIIRRVRNEEEGLDGTIKGKINNGQEISEEEYLRLDKNSQKQYLNTYLYNQLKQVMNYNIERFKTQEREEDVPFYYEDFRGNIGEKKSGKDQFGTGTALVGGPSDMYTLLDISLGKLEEGRETGGKYGLLMNIDQPLILQGVLGKAEEVGYRVGEFGPFDDGERTLLGAVMDNFEKKSLQLLESIGRGEAFAVVDPRNYRTKVLNPFRALLDPLIGSDLAQYGGRLEQLVAAKGSGTDYDERLKNLTDYMRERVSRDQLGLAEGLAKQMLAITSSNIQMATHPKAHAKGFSLFEIAGNGIQYLINSMGSGNYTPGSTLPSLKELREITGENISEEDYKKLAKTSSNELSLQGYDPQVVEGSYTSGDSGFLAKSLADEQGEHLQKSFDELTYSGKFRDIQTSLEEGGPAKFQGTDARWEQGVDIGRTGALQKRIQTMFDESGLGERGATAELIRDTKSNASRILVTLNYNQLTEGSGLANKKYELSVMQGGQVYLINKGLIVSSAVFTNESGMTINNFMGEGSLTSGETKDLSSEDVALSLFGTLALEAVNQGIVEMPRAFRAQDTSNSAFYHFLADVLGTDRTSPLRSNFIKGLKTRFKNPESRLQVFAKLSEELFKGEFLDKKAEQKYTEILKDILLKNSAKSGDRLEQVLGLIIDIQQNHPESRILHKVYSSSSAFAFELNERLQNLESNLLKPFLTYTQGHTYSASTETTRKIHLGITTNPFQQKAIEMMNEGGFFGIAQYAAMALPYAGTISDISRALITSVAGGVAQISDDPLSTFFGTRTQSYEEVKSLDLIEILSVGSRLDKKVIEDYLKIRGEGGSDDEDVQEIEQRFIAKLGNNQFITTFGGSSKFSQIGQRLKNVGGSRALLEMSYSAQYLVEGRLNKNELVRKLSQDAFGFLFDPELLPRIAELEKKRELLKLHKDSNSFFKDFSVEYSAYLKEIDSFSSDSNTSIDTNTREDRRDIVLTLAAQISEVGRAAKSSGLGLIITRTELGSLYTSYSKNLSEAEFGKLVGQTEQFISLAKKLYETKKQFEEFEGFTYDPTSADSITSASSLQQAYVENLRKALTLYGIDSNLAKSLVPDEYGVAAIAGGRIREVMPSDAYQVLLQDREELMQLTGKDKAFFEGPVGKELLRAKAAYRDTETMGARGFLGSRRKEKGYSLLQLGGFYYDANFFYNPEYDGGVRYFFTDRVKKTVMANQLGLDNFEVEVQAGDVIRSIDGSESYAVFRKEQGGDEKEIGRVSNRSQVEALSKIIDPLSSHNVPSTSTVTRKASTPPGRKANELVISKVQRASTSKAGIEIELSLARSVELTGGAREDIAQGLLKGVGIGDKPWFEYARETLGLEEGSSVFGLINESSMKSYIYGHGLTIAHNKSLQEDFLKAVRSDPKKAAAALLYMFGTEAFTEDKKEAQSLESIYTEKALGGEFGKFFQEEAVALAMEGKSALKSGFSRLQLPSLGIQSGSKMQEIKEALEGSPNALELVSYIEKIVQAAIKEPFSTTGAGGEGLVGREADLIITAIDFYQQLSQTTEKVLPPAFDVTQDESLRTLALGMNYSPLEIEEALQDKEKRDKLIRNIASQSSSYALRFYQIPTPGQMKTPLSSKTASKAEIQSRLNPFVTTGDSFSPSNPTTKKIRGILTAGLLSIPSKDRPASAVIKAAQEVNVASLGDEEGRKELKKLVSLQEAHKTLSSYNASDIRPFKKRLQKLGEFEAAFYKATNDISMYNLETLEDHVNSASADDLDAEDKNFILTRITELKIEVNKRVDKSQNKSTAGITESRKAVKSLFFQAASEISMGVREQSLLFSQDSSQQYTIDLAQKFIKNLSSSGTRTLGLELPRLIEIGLNQKAEVRTRYSLSKEDFATGVILEGEYLEVLKAAELQDFVTEVLSTQYRLQEMLTEGHVLKGVLRKLLEAQKKKSTSSALSLELTDEEHRAYTEFTNLLDQSAGQLTESLSDSYIKKVLGAQESPGYVATGVGLLGLGSQKTVVPAASIKRTFEPQPHRKAALKSLIDRMSTELQTGTNSLDIHLLQAEANAIIEGISPEAKQRYNLYKSSKDNFNKIVEGSTQEYLEDLVEKHKGQGDEYVYRVLLEAERADQKELDIKIQDFEDRYVRNNPKSLLLDLDKDKAEQYIKELEEIKKTASGDKESIDAIINDLQDYLYTLDLGENLYTDNPSEKELWYLLNKISFQQEFLEKGYEPFIRSLRSAPTGSMIISKSSFKAIELSELNQAYADTADQLKKLEIAEAKQYFSQIDSESSDTLNILPLLSTVTTMLGDFDGDQIISSFVTYSDKILKRVKLKIDLDINKKDIEKQQALLGLDPNEEEAKKQIKRLNKAQEGLKNRLNVVEQEITSLNSDFDINKINRAVISHVSRYLGIDESYFLGGTQNYYYQLLDEHEKVEYQEYQELNEAEKSEHSLKEKFQFIPSKDASLEYMVSRLEQGRGLLGSLEKGKDNIEKYKKLIENIENDDSTNPSIKEFIEKKKKEGLTEDQIAQLLAAAHKTGKTIGKIGSLAKGFEQDEKSLMLSLLVIGEAGSVILGKTYNVLYGSLLADAPIIALKTSLENNEEAYKKALKEDLNLTEDQASREYSSLFSEVTGAFEKTQALKAFTMSIEQMMRDSIKPKNNDTFLKDLKKKVEEYEQADTEEEKNKIIRDLTKSLGSGPKGLLSLINLHDFLGAKQGTLSHDRKKTFVDQLLRADDLKIVTEYLGIKETNDSSELLDSDLDKVLHYAISRDVLNTSAGFMYERTLNLESNLDYIDPSGVFEQAFSKSIKKRLEDGGFLTSKEGSEESKVELSYIRDLGLKGFLEHYNKDSGALYTSGGLLTTKGFQAVEFWLTRHKDSTPLFGVDGENLPKLKALKDIQNALIQEGTLNATEIETLDIIIAKTTLEAASRAKGSAESIFQTLLNVSVTSDEDEGKDSLTKMIEFLDNQNQAGIYNSKEAETASTNLKTILEAIKNKLNKGDADSEKRSSEVLRLIETAFGLTYTGEANNLLEAIEAKAKTKSESKTKDADYLSYQPSVDVYTRDPHIAELEKWVQEDKLSFNANIDQGLAAQTADRLRGEGAEIALESLFIPALILGHAIATGYDPSAAGAEIIGQQVVGGTMISALYSNNLFSRMEQNNLKDTFKRASSRPLLGTTVGSAAKVRLTMAQDEEDSIISGVIRTLGMEAMFTASSILTSRVIEAGLNTRRNISKVLDIDALESTKTAASFVSTALISAAVGLTTQNAVKQVIRPSALETLQSVVANINQYVSHQRTQTAKYETETVDMETEVDIPVYELTAITDYVQADMVSEHILSLSSTEMSGELIEEPIFVRSAEGEEV